MKISPSFAMLFCVLVVQGVFASTSESIWTETGTGFWSEPANWSNGVPNHIDNPIDALIDNTSTVIVKQSFIVERVGVGRSSHAEILVSEAGALSSDDSFYLGELSTGSGTIVLSGTASLNNRFQHNKTIVGGSGRGLIVQADDTYASYGEIELGQDPDGQGRYELSGGTMRFHNLRVGGRGHGEFIQTGGIVDASRGSPVRFILGDQIGGYGRYELSGGTFDNGARVFLIGLSGTGEFVNTGGLHFLRGYDVFLGVNATSVGTYHLSGSGEFISADELYVGNDGKGQFIQEGGTYYVDDTKVGVMSGDGLFELVGDSGVTQTNAFELGVNGTLKLRVDATGVGTIEVTRQALLSGKLVIEDDGALPGTWDVFTADGGIVNNLDSIQLPANGLWSADVGQQVITLTRVVPEPTSLTLLGLGGLLIARRRHK